MHKQCENGYIKIYLCRVGLAYYSGLYHRTILWLYWWWRQAKVLCQALSLHKYVESDRTEVQNFHRNRQRPPEGGQATSQAVGNSTGDEESSLNIICGILTGSEDVDMSWFTKANNSFLLKGRRGKGFFGDRQSEFIRTNRKTPQTCLEARLTISGYFGTTHLYRDVLTYLVPLSDSLVGDADEVRQVVSSDCNLLMH
jgi:hypothetical protein